MDVSVARKKQLHQRYIVHLQRLDALFRSQVPSGPAGLDAEDGEEEIIEARAGALELSYKAKIVSTGRDAGERAHLAGWVRSLCGCRRRRGSAEPAKAESVETGETQPETDVDLFIRT